jgi:hypothetical protein
MEKDIINLDGMDAAGAKEYILGFISTLKLTEKQVEALDAERCRWNTRIDLAKSKGRADLAAEAEKELERITSRRCQLLTEIDGLQSQIAEMRRQLPLLAARERSVDPDLLEQELLMAAGYLPGEEVKAQGERLFSDLEKTAAADAALLELKAKLASKN